MEAEHSRCCFLSLKAGIIYPPAREPSLPGKWHVMTNEKNNYKDTTCIQKGKPVCSVSLSSGQNI